MGLLRNKGRWWSRIAQEQGFLLGLSQDQRKTALLGWPGCGKLYLCRSKSLCGLSIYNFSQDEGCNFFRETWWFSKKKLVSFSRREYTFQYFCWRLKMLSWRDEIWKVINKQTNKQTGSKNREDICPYVSDIMGNQESLSHRLSLKYTLLTRKGHKKYNRRQAFIACSPMAFF